MGVRFWIALGFAVGSLILLDDIEQHQINDQEMKRHAEQEMLAAEALRKHEVEIQALREEAEKADTLAEINEQLREMIIQIKGSDYYEKEEVFAI